MVWGGISLEGRTDLYRLDNGTLTAIRYQDEILGPVVSPYAGAVGPGFLLVHNNARPHVVRVCRQFLENEGIDTIDGPTGSPDLNPIEHLWDIMFRSIRRHQVALQTVQELNDVLVQIWEEIPQDTTRSSVVRTPSGPPQNKYYAGVSGSDCWTPQRHCWTENRPPTKTIHPIASCGERPVTTDEGLEDEH
ncbi:hypothetical protein NFI96_009770, partial [Prochilodus magdalenae]